VDSTDHMKQSLALVSLIVRDYDEAIDFFVNTLGFVLVENSPVPDQGKRWVVVAPPGASESRLLLARASTTEQQSRIGTQTGGRVFLFLHTDNFWRDYESYKARGVVFVREPRDAGPRFRGSRRGSRRDNRSVTTVRPWRRDGLSCSSPDSLGGGLAPASRHKALA
jgi:catechol 2,3-dioxygenase-like lactoylglutathione lyase family enzyme